MGFVCIHCLTAAALCCKCLHCMVPALRDQWLAIRANRTPLEEERHLFGRPLPSLYLQLQSALDERWWLWALPIPRMDSPNLEEVVFQKNYFTGRYEEAPIKALSPAHPSSAKGHVKLMQAIKPRKKHILNAVWHKVQPKSAPLEV